jgi:hypothetical protein
MANSLVIASVVAFLITGAGVARADYTPDGPTGHFLGTAVSKEAGRPAIPLDLRCVNQPYQGELVRPVATYTRLVEYWQKICRTA